jgi:hypothetical protein
MRLPQQRGDSNRDSNGDNLRRTWAPGRARVRFRTKPFLGSRRVGSRCKRQPYPCSRLLHGAPWPQFDEVIFYLTEIGQLPFTTSGDGILPKLVTMSRWAGVG